MYDWNPWVENLWQGTFVAATVIACAYPLIVIATGALASPLIPFLLGFLIVLILACLAEPPGDGT